MRALLFVLTILSAFLPAHAQAEDQVLRYQLLLDGDVVGHREVEIRYWPSLSQVG